MTEQRPPGIRILYDPIYIGMDGRKVLEPRNYMVATLVIDPLKPNMEGVKEALAFSRVDGLEDRMAHVLWRVRTGGRKRSHLHHAFQDYDSDLITKLLEKLGPEAEENEWFPVAKDLRERVLSDIREHPETFLNEVLLPEIERVAATSGTENRYLSPEQIRAVRPDYRSKRYKDYHGVLTETLQTLIGTMPRTTHHILGDEKTTIIIAPDFCKNFGQLGRADFPMRTIILDAQLFDKGREALLKRVLKEEANIHFLDMVLGFSAQKEFLEATRTTLDPKENHYNAMMALIKKVHHGERGVEAALDTIVIENASAELLAEYFHARDYVLTNWSEFSPELVTPILRDAVMERFFPHIHALCLEFERRLEERAAVLPAVHVEGVSSDGPSGRRVTKQV